MGVVGRRAHRVTASVEFWERGVKEESWEASFTGKEYYLLVHYRAVRRVRRGEYSVRSKKDPTGRFYIVTGEKKWITNGIWADYFTVAVRTGGKGSSGISLLVIEKSMKGVECKRMDCMGVWASGTTFITFDEVRVPVENLIGNENEGFKYIMHNFNHERWGFVVQANRFARVCYEEAFTYAHRRRTFGQRLIDHAVIRHKLAEMIRQIEATHNLLENITYQMNTLSEEQKPKMLAGITALAKVQATKVFEFWRQRSGADFWRRELRPRRSG